MLTCLAARSHERVPREIGPPKAIGTCAAEGLLGVPGQRGRGGAARRCRPTRPPVPGTVPGPPNHRRARGRSPGGDDPTGSIRLRLEQHVVARHMGAIDAGRFQVGEDGDRCYYAARPGREHRVPIDGVRVRSRGEQAASPQAPPTQSYEIHAIALAAPGTKSLVGDGLHVRTDEVVAAAIDDQVGA